MQTKRHINILMLVLSVIGGIIGYVFGEIIINFYRYRIHNVLLVGMYFGVFSLCVLVMCFIAELIKPSLTGNLWRKKTWKLGLLIIPVAVIVMFGAGCLTQFIYGLGHKTTGSVHVDDYVFMIDESGSMEGNDPDKQRISATVNLVEHMTPSNRVAFYAFTENTDKVVDLQYVNNKNKADIIKAIKGFSIEGGGTDIRKVLKTALKDVDDKVVNGREMALVLLSDGEDSFKTKDIIKKCVEKGIRIHCIGLGNSLFSNGNIMNELANETDGNYYDIQSADQLLNVFHNIQKKSTGTRLLLDRRYGADRTGFLFGLERVIFISLFGILLGLSLGFIFDNRQLFKNFAIGGAITGVLAGLVMEIGLYAHLNTRLCRLIMDILLSIVICALTAIRAYDINYGQTPRENPYSFSNITGYNDGMSQQTGNTNSDPDNNVIGRF